MIVLITGATAGFGEAFARKFIENGHTVIGTGRRIERPQNCKRVRKQIFPAGSGYDRQSGSR